MNNLILNKYGIYFYKKTNGDFRVTADSKDLAIFIERFSDSKSQVVNLLGMLNLALNGHYSDIPYDDREWHQELGLNVHTGIIQDDMTFDLFMEDYYDETLETFPIFDIKEIFNSLLEFIS